MHDHGWDTAKRVTRFLRERLEPAVHPERVPLRVEHWVSPDGAVPFERAVGERFAPTPDHWEWGTPWSTTWFRLTGTVPAEWADRTVEVLCDLGFTADRPGFQVEGLAYRADGAVVKAVSPRSSQVPLHAGEREVELYVEGAANPDVTGDWTFTPTALGDPATLTDEPQYRLGGIDLAVRDRTVWELLQDVRLLHALTAELPADSPRRALIERGLDRMLDVVDPDDVGGTAAAGRAELAPLLASPATASSHRLVAVGHAHIDSAWLWPVRETARKVARTFANALQLMEESDEYVFAASSAQQYVWLKEQHPALFERLRERVREGRFVPVGGMWVEADTNMPSGEAMIRQFAFAKRFFREELGVETEEVWLPDSFGYSAALPQIVRGTGNRWFLTQKLSWNQVNAIPHHTFLWEGIDGSRVFTHLPPADTYGSELTPGELLHAERTFRDAGAARTSLVPFGWGDGGGGPTREMLAAAERSRDLEGLPRVRIDTPRHFFETAEAEYADPPVWSGEMYLELHRGTYTSQLRTKQGNRRGEALLREAELWATIAAVRAGAEYPVETLAEAWRSLLLLQFHDILPGSSIAWVHQDAERTHARLRGSLEEVVSRSLRALAGDGDRTLTANPRSDAAGGVPAFGVGPAAAAADAARLEAGADGDGSTVLDNGVVRAVVDAHGRIVSLTNRADGREAIAPGGWGNRLVLHRDTPAEWDAWDIDEHYRRTAVDLSAEPPRLVASAVADDGIATVRIERSFGRSTLAQELRLEPGAEALEIVTRIDWHEKQKLLKLTVDLDVHAQTTASETQFGHVRRATHSNTSWEAARFEFCAHRWIHVGEPGFGVAIANDSTYGHDARTRPREGGGRTTTVGLSLVHAPLYPDPTTDQGEHTLRVALRPAATIRDAIATGEALNLPRRVVAAAERAVEPLFAVDSATVVAETVKLADDGSGDVILRCYESSGARGSVRVAARFPHAGWRRTDLLEHPVDDVVTAGDAELTVRAFEIVTLRFTRA